VSELIRRVLRGSQTGEPHGVSNTSWWASYLLVARQMRQEASAGVQRLAEGMCLLHIREPNMHRRPGHRTRCLTHPTLMSIYESFEKLIIAGTAMLGMPDRNQETAATNPL
jgi:hypothetical protein